jgi:hypothetical protein
MGYQIEKYRLGTAIDCTVPANIAHALAEMLTSDTEVSPSPDFLAGHTGETFTATILDEMLGDR